MNKKKTEELDGILKQASLKTFSEYERAELGEKLPELADFLNVYIAEHGLVLPEVIKGSLLSPDYAYALFNGNRKNPARDRMIALCLAMKMNLEEAQRALKLCNAGVLYSKSRRDALLMICFNTDVFDVMKVNTVLEEHGMPILETSKDAAK